MKCNHFSPISVIIYSYGAIRASDSRCVDTKKEFEKYLELLL